MWIYDTPEYHPYQEGLNDIKEMERLNKLVKILMPIAQRFFWKAELRNFVSTEPDLTQEMPTKNEVNRFIERQMMFFEDELVNSPEHWNAKDITHPPQFDKLDGGAKLAFYQAWYEAKKRFYGRQ